MTAATDIETRAAEWLVRLDADASAATRAEFEAWIHADMRRRAAFLRLNEIWRRADRLKNLRPLDGTVDENLLDKIAEEHLVPEPQPRKARKWWIFVAAALAAATIGWSAWMLIIRSEWDVYKTDLGAFQRVTLRDGSTAQLNTNSELRVRYRQERREVVLARGEALFTVVHDTRRPFDVQAGETIVRAVGTAFCVRLRDQKQVDVLVTEGRVAIDPPDDSFDRKTAESVSPPHLSTLAAGETVSVTAHRLHVAKVNSDELTRKLAWTQGRLWFDRVTLNEAAGEFNRYNQRQLVVADPALAEMHISGAFAATDLDSFVAALRTFGIRAFSTRSKADDPDTEIIRLGGAKAPQ